MKDVDLNYVNSHLKIVEYAKRVVRILNAYPERDGFRTYQYQFKRQNPSKVSVPCADIPNLQWQADDDGNIFIVVDGTYIREVNENGFKRLISRKEEKAASEDSIA